MLNIKKIKQRTAQALSSLAFAFTAAAFPMAAQAQNQPTISTESIDGLRGTESFLVIGEDGQEFLSSNADTPVPPASTVKLMTAYMTMRALREGVIDLDDPVTLSRKSVNIRWDYRRSGMPAGRTFTVRQGLEMMFVYSANDVASSMGAHLSKAYTGDWSEDNFVTMMNALAQALGMNDTEFKDASGMDDSARVTARDMALLVNAIALEFPELHDGDPEFPDFPTQNGMRIKGGWRSNTNFFVRETDNQFSFQPVAYEGEIQYRVEGWKTGYTDPAGSCLLTSAVAYDPRVDETYRVIIAFYGGKSGKKRNEAVEDMFEAAFEARFAQPLPVVYTASLTSGELPVEPFDSESQRPQNRSYASNNGAYVSRSGTPSPIASYMSPH